MKSHSNLEISKELTISSLSQAIENFKKYTGPDKREGLAQAYEKRAQVYEKTQANFKVAEADYEAAATLYVSAEAGEQDLVTAAGFCVKAANVRIQNALDDKKIGGVRWAAAAHFSITIEYLKLYTGTDRRELLAHAYALRAHEYEEVYGNFTAAENDYLAAAKLFDRGGEDDAIAAKFYIKAAKVQIEHNLEDKKIRDLRWAAAAHYTSAIDNHLKLYKGEDRRELLAHAYELRAHEYEEVYGNFTAAENDYVAAAKLFDRGGEDFAIRAKFYIKAANVQIEHNLEDKRIKGLRWAAAAHYSTAIEYLKLYTGAGRRELLAQAYELRAQEYEEVYRNFGAAEADYIEAVNLYYGQDSEIAALFYIKAANVEIKNLPNDLVLRRKVAGYFTTAIDLLNEGLNCPTKYLHLATVYGMRAQEYQLSYKRPDLAEKDFLQASQNFKLAQEIKHSKYMKRLAISARAHYKEQESQHKHKHRHGFNKIVHSVTKPFNPVIKPVAKAFHEVDKFTQKITQPIIKPITKFLSPVMSPIAKLIAPYNKVLGLFNAVLTPLTMLASGGTLQQVFATIIREQFITRITAPLQNTINHIINPFDALVNDIMKPVSPLLAAVQNTSTAINNTGKIVANLKLEPAKQQISDNSLSDKFLSDKPRGNASLANTSVANTSVANKSATNTPVTTAAVANKQSSPAQQAGVAQQIPIKSATQAAVKSAVTSPVKPAVTQPVTQAVKPAVNAQAIPAPQQATKPMVQQTATPQLKPTITLQTPAKSSLALDGLKAGNSLISKAASEVINNSNLSSNMKNIANTTNTVQAGILNSTVCIAKNLSDGADIKTTLRNCGGEQIQDLIQSTAENIVNSSTAKALGQFMSSTITPKVIGGVAGAVVGEILCPTSTASADKDCISPEHMRIKK
jgi:hypothetical protein